MLACKNRGNVTIRDMTHTAVTVEQLNKHVSAELNSHNRRPLFSVVSLLRGCKKDKGDCSSQLSFEMPACQDMSLGAEELSEELREPLEMAVKDN
jgi:hypothetical protein